MGASWGEAFAKWSPQQQFLLTVVVGAVFLVVLVLLGLWLFSFGRVALDALIVLCRGHPPGTPESQPTITGVRVVPAGERVRLTTVTTRQARLPGECPNSANRTGRCLNPFFECMTAAQCEWLLTEI